MRYTKVCELAAVVAGSVLLINTTGGAVAQEAAPAPNDNLDAVLWTQRSVEFTRYADGRGVKVFYVTNRTAEEEPATRENMAALGFPIGGNVDTLPTAKEQPDWSSAKSTRRAAIAKDYRILLLVGDNLGDFSDGYKGDEAARLKVYQDNAERWGKDWIVIANPTYGSFESAPYGHDYRIPVEAQRAAKEEALEAWPGP